MGVGRNPQMYNTQSLRIRSSHSSWGDNKQKNNIWPRAMMKKWDTENKGVLFKTVVNRFLKN